MIVIIATTAIAHVVIERAIAERLNAATRFQINDMPRLVPTVPEYQGRRIKWRDTSSPYKTWRSRMRRRMERATHRAQRRARR